MVGSVFFSLVLLCFATLGLDGRSTDSCHLKGICVGGNFFEGTAQEDYKESLVCCWENAECSWFTFDSDGGLCMLDESCPEINAGDCSTCFSGERDCPSYPGSCDVSGSCSGALIGLDDGTEFLEQCQELCFNKQKCEWYTFYPDSHSCVQTVTTSMSLALMFPVRVARTNASKRAQVP